MILGQPLSEQIFSVVTSEDLSDWLLEVDRELLGTSWYPLGGIANNVHTVEVASDPALALVERPTNSIDALLDLRARELGEGARSPHEGARKWWGVPSGGLSKMSDTDRRTLADRIRVTMHESEMAFCFLNFLVVT